MNPTTDVPVRHQRCAGVGEQPVAGHMIDVKVRVDSEFDGEVRDFADRRHQLFGRLDGAERVDDDDAIVTEDEPGVAAALCFQEQGC